MPVTLATTYHDPRDRLYDQLAATLPILARTFAGMAVQVSATSPARSLALLAKAGAVVTPDVVPPPVTGASFGLIRRAALGQALRLGADHVLFFDLDSLIHWAERYPDELAASVARVPACDLTLFGRSERARSGHPRSQLETERWVNHVFAEITGHAWDVMRSGRGLSRRAAEAILAECPEPSIAVDVAWPLFLLAKGGFSAQSIEVDGAEFETADRYGPEIAAAGGYDAWLRAIDADPRRWARRLEFARLHLEAMIPYAGPDTHLEPGRGAPT